MLYIYHNYLKLQAFGSLNRILLRGTWSTLQLSECSSLYLSGYFQILLERNVEKDNS